jgi:hypothetical protein
MEITKDLLIIGLERSVKFSHRSINSDRFIIGPQHKSLTADHLKIILTGLNFPGQIVPQALECFTKSNQTGLGFEQNNGISSYRLYFEFFDRFKGDPSINNGILHLGYKWRCDDPEQMSVTKYTFAPLFDGNNVEQTVKKILATFSQSFVNDVVTATVKSLSDIPPKARIVTCASEERGCRNSFDINIYRSLKKVSYLRNELENIARFFKIEESAVKKFLDETSDASLGHISCGFDSINNPFFTVYFDDLSSIINKVKKT